MMNAFFSASRAALLLLALVLGGCFNDPNSKHIDLGSVSIGQQLIDLEAARDADVISELEYRRMKKGLIEAVTTLSDGEDADDSDTAEYAEEDEDSFRWF